MGGGGTGAERQRGIEAERQRGREAERHSERQKERQRGREADKSLSLRPVYSTEQTPRKPLLHRNLVLKNTKNKETNKYKSSSDK